MTTPPAPGSPMPASRVLVANRGEIAIRVCTAAHAVGLVPVAVTTADEPGALHARHADVAVPLPGTGVAAYLDVEAVVAAAREAGAQLLHPGYGFLSESAELARACERAGVGFVGPSPEVLVALGDKREARARAERLGIPVLRGASSVAAARALLADAGGVMVKAAHGGGGRGMRPVRDVASLAAEWDRASSEAGRSFGQATVYAEELLDGARHIEVQVAGDGATAVAVGDRDCSVQRRRQKVLEIAPAVTVPREVRGELADAAERLAGDVGLRGVATVEFLVAPGRWVFLEVNPRIQVEHPVTEEVAGVDLVAAQLRLALGARLADVGLAGRPAERGIAVETRVCAERVEPDGSTIATSGRVTACDLPGGPGVRVDTWLRTGAEVTGRYDPLLAKVITHAPAGSTLEEAIDRQRSALADVLVTGVATNTDFLDRVLAHDVVRGGAATTTFVDDHLADLVTPPVDADDTHDIVAPMVGTVLEVRVRPGDRVQRHDEVVLLEAMKMEHVLRAPHAGTVAEVRSEPGATVSAGEPLVVMAADDSAVVEEVEEEVVDLDAVRADLESVRARHRVTLDEARPEAVAKRHATGRRTARENLAHLLDDGSFREYGALAIAAQRRRRHVDDLVLRTPADGIVTGVGDVNGTRGVENPACAVLAYDYTVMAGTQGYLNHKKTDRMLELARDRRLPVVLFAEGGGGRPGDTDTTSVSGLDVPTFATMASLHEVVPTVGIVAGRCFAGNAALLGCCDVVIAARDANIGMGGPAMIEGGGLGAYAPEDIGPAAVQHANGVVDVLVDDEAAAVEVAQRYLAYVQQPHLAGEHAAADPRLLRHLVPENRRRAYDIRGVVRALADEGSVLELRDGFGAGIVTALARLGGRAVGVVANNPEHLGGAIDADAADKMARFLGLCERYRLPVVSLCDTPGFMVGPASEEEATVRRFADLFVAGARLTVPVVAVVVRKGYGLGAQAMATGSFRQPVATLAWPTGEVGAMGLEGAVRLGYRRELEAEPTAEARQRRYDELVAAAYEAGRATNAAQAFELDAVIDPAETPAWIRTALEEHPSGPAGRPTPRRTP
ncbi:Biotin carboxylase [Nostocoides japonicum T1-X7]|uniref:Biotin carboxylase n=1 Tax=Nostocoides japonicum T1-X7 TaxID=1194083 RepID=A0A077LWF1_9MICO|nr:Biotin carboxylase [Tetrasphaera japonica T1-X7]